MAFRWQITPVATWVGYDEPPSLASGKPAPEFKISCTTSAYCD